MEPLEKLPRSVREFLSHYAMIVLSILTALALEQALVGVEHRHQGEAAYDEIAQEIAANRAKVENALRETLDNLHVWEKLLADTVAAVKSGQSTDESRIATLTQATRNFRDSTPSLSTGAWEAALSSHAVDYLPHDELRHFSGLYAVQREFSRSLWDIVRESAVRSLNDLTLPIYVGKADPVDTISVLSSRTRMLSVMASQLSQIDDALKAASPSEPAAAPALAASR